MKLRKLRLVGFKSFVEPAEIVIEPGLTGIVGPNGCGKSNLVEALRWVMGEASSRAMRAADMDDVIFAGSHSRPPRNAAEVSLILDNAAGRAPAPFAEAEILEVVRRIERDLGSTYRINRREVRARDVQILFADASTGARSPSMVRQGQVAELIAARPAARRAILEEAAGISGLHARRQEAEARLKAAEQNLVRVEDVLGGFDARLESLRRQARQSARYRNLSAEIRATQALLLHLQWRAACAAVATAEAALGEANRALASHAAEQARAAREQAVAAHELAPAREAAARAAAAAARLKAGLVEIEGEERRVGQRLAELERRQAEIREDRAREARRVDEAKEAVARLSAETQEFDAAESQAAARSEAIATSLDEAEARLRAAEAAHEAAVRRTAEAAAARRALERAAQAARRTCERVAETRARLARDRQSVQERAGAASALDEARAAHDAALSGLSDAEARVAAAERKAGEARDALDRARAVLSATEREAAQATSERNALARLLGGVGPAHGPVLADLVAVTPGAERALAAALGDDLDFSLDSRAPVHWGEPGSGADDPRLPPGAVPLAAVVEGPPALARRLAQIGLARREDGETLASSLKPGQKLVSREGDFWRWDGLRGKAGAPSAAAKRFEIRNRLSELDAAGKTIETRLAEDRRRAAAAEAEARLAAEEERRGREAARLAARAAASAREALARLEQEAARISDRLSALVEAEARLVPEAAEADEALSIAEAALAQEPPTAEIDRDLAAASAEVNAARAAAVERRAESAALAREAETAARRRAALRSERSAAAARAEAAVAQAKVLAGREEEIAAEIARLAERPARLAAERRRLLQDLPAAEALRAEASDRLARLETEAADADRAAKAALQALAASREAQGRAEERLAAACARAAEADARIAAELGVPAAESARLAGLAPGVALPERESVEKRLSHLLEQRDCLGPVNLRAEDELAELEAAKASLAAERDDLIEAIRRLRQGLQTLNGEARTRLRSAFDAVNAHFQSLFSVLFGGGAAELKLVEADDPLEAGLDILARPPGKRPQTISLLSGGEQALTAIALVFAVFLTNPAPICVLDEVDAPLDDANVERFCGLLAHMADKTETRFLVITHNPITMARMDRLFGVTMAEKGVSQLVSVDLRRAETWREAG